MSAGHNLLDPKNPKYSVNIINQCYQIIKGDYLLLSPDGKNCKALYQIEEDPYQKHNIKNQQPKIVDNMLSLLQKNIYPLN